MGTKVAKGPQHDIKAHLKKIVQPLKFWQGTADGDRDKRKKAAQKGLGPYGFPHQWPDAWTNGEHPMDFEEAVQLAFPENIEKLRLNKKIVDKYIT